MSAADCPPPPLEIIAAPYTPFHADGRVNLAQIGLYADALVERGVSGVFICGTTGEGMSLSAAERKAVAEEWVRVARGRLSIIVHVGHQCLADARDLASHAESIQASAFSAVAPSFFVPQTTDLLIDCCARIASAAPTLPFYYYHIPSMSHARFLVADWMGKAADTIPNFRGVKYTHEDLSDFGNCLQLRGSAFKCYFGRDELLLSGLRLGARATVGSTYNYASRLYRALDCAFLAGDMAEAERLQRLSCSFIEVLGRYGFFGAAKSLMEYAGVDCGSPRLPLAPLSPAKKADLCRDLEATGLFDYL